MGNPYGRVLLDRDVRAALRQRLTVEHDGATLIRDELGLCLGETRVDIAVVNGILAGYEIKSARDRLDRLPAQVALYGRVLDTAVLVAAGRHLDKAVDLLDAWWGVWRAIPEDGGVTFEEVRPAGRNPNTDALSVAQLLWRDEALEVLEERGLAKGLRGGTRWRLWQALADHLELDDLAGEVRSRLRARQAW